MPALQLAELDNLSEPTLRFLFMYKKAWPKENNGKRSSF
jgi:hypothetical protein